MSKAMKSLNVSWCEKFPILDTQFDCFHKLAVAKKDISLCERIELPISKKESCYFQVAQVLDDVTLCEKLANIIDKNQCIMTIEAK